MKRIKGFDSLRAIAVLLVIKYHWGPGSFKTLPVLDFITKYILPSGLFAVDFFFVLSGFLITKILLQSKAQSSGQSKWGILKTFVIRRSLRIFPIYYLFLLIVYIVDLPGIRQNISYYVVYAANYLCFSQSGFGYFGHTWTLSIEEQFYLFWPLFILFVPDKYLMISTWTIVAVSIITHYFTRNAYGEMANVLTVNCLDAFAIGGLYALSLKQQSRVSFAAPGWLLLLIFAVILYIAQYFGITPIPLRLANSIIAVALIIRVNEMKYSRIEAAILENKVLNSIGKISYGIYLFHFPFPLFYVQLLKYFKVPDNAALYIPIIAELIQFCALILVAYASFYLFEMQFLKIKRLFKYNSVALPTH